MRHKKIALFISHIYGEYQHNLSQGIIDRALEYGYQTQVIATNDGENLGTFSSTEESVLQLPVYRNLDGIIFASGTYANPELREQLREKIASLGQVPVLEVADTGYSFPRISLENNITAGTLAEHMITVHGASRICYLGDVDAPDISRLRSEAVRRVLQEHGLTPGEQDFPEVHLYDDEETYRAVLRDLTDGGASFPDAVICYNDAMALALWQAAEEEGYRIPEDFALTGCDNSEAGQNHMPPLTTVSYPIYELGSASVDSLLTLIKGKSYHQATVFAEAIYGGSCGCSYRRDKNPHPYSDALEHRIVDLERSILTSARMSSAFSHAVELEDGLEYIADFAAQIRDCTGFFLCLTEDWDRLSGRTRQLTEGTSEPAPSSDRIELLLAMKDGKRLPQCTFQNDSLLPDFLADEGEFARIVSPIYHHKDTYGYIVMTFRDNRLTYPFWLIQWLVNISQLLYNLRNRKKTEALSERLEEIYMTDPLTGLLNKNGFAYHRSSFLEKLPEDAKVCAIFLDMNKLKAINDTYGHAEGDFAIQILGQAIRQSCNETELTGRIGGDEFNILLCGDEEAAESILKKIRRYLGHYNSLGDKPYQVSASAGFACAVCRESEDLEELFQEADRKMYLEKQNRT
jgi:diguanylate cyclase (GGDEF)-like protein